ncbi:hypothetical protein DKP78_20200 [Enterococcus faecium]|nr:hypothetical protein DKP78_20200 [Enterococcus faecium]
MPTLTAYVWNSGFSDTVSIQNHPLDGSRVPARGEAQQRVVVNTGPSLTVHFMFQLPFSLVVHAAVILIPVVVWFEWTILVQA